MDPWPRVIEIFPNVLSLVSVCVLSSKPSAWMGGEGRGGEGRGGGREEGGEGRGGERRKGEGRGREGREREGDEISE